MILTSLERSGINVIPQARLADYTTFKLGGPCRALIECCNASHVETATRALRAEKIPFLVMGFGSNILTSDKGIDLVMLRYSTQEPVIEHEQNHITVDAATQLDDLALYAINAGLDGMTAFSGIPGTVGGAIAGNAGAYGQQISDHLIYVTLLRPDGTTLKVQKADIRFTYRDSDIKHSDDIILNAEFELPAGDKKSMTEKRAETIRIREEKHGKWQTSPCAGSFFKNVEPTSKAGPRQSAGWYLEQAGAKGLRVAGAHSYKNHANIITRDQYATAQDVLDLTKAMADIVEQKFSIKLVREVRLLGEFANTPECNCSGYW
jgi:UDP-N-acetylmuramate dehydrogenase